MEDVTPLLFLNIKRDFTAAFKGNKKIAALYEKVRDGTATYKEVNDFAIETGETLAAAFRTNLRADILPDGKMYYNIANRLIPATLQNNYDLISEVAKQVQENLNIRAGIGIKAIRPELNTDRIDGFVEKVSNAENYDDVAWVLNEPVVNFSQSIVDDYIRANAEFQWEAGMRPRIIRTTVGKCCEWCQKLAGTYFYPNVPRSVYRRHERCRCTVDYMPEAGNKRQNVHTKQWKNTEEHDKIEIRKNVGISLADKEPPGDRESRISRENGFRLAEQLASHPKMLQAYTPKGLKQSLAKSGYDVRPLNNGTLKGVPFEDGGGYKVNFSDGGIIMYHPKERSHHKGEYYKISTGKGGRHRYDTTGEEIRDD